MIEKLVKIRELNSQIEMKVAIWLDTYFETGPLFTNDEVEAAIYEIPRWPLLVHLIAAII